MNNEGIVFLDMDGVCCGFVEAVGRLFDVNDITSKITPGNWDFYKDIGVTVGGLWKAIRECGEAFWFRMEELESNNILYYNLIKIAKVYYLTTPEVSVAASWSGKLMWLRRVMGQGFGDVVMCKNKELLAGPNRVLIDDKIKNVQRFNEHGGYGILFPQRWNTPAGTELAPIDVRAHNVLTLVEKHFGVSPSGGFQQLELDLNLM